MHSLHRRLFLGTSLGRAGTAREHEDAVAETHEGLQPLLDVRQDHQVIDDRVRRLRRGLLRYPSWLWI